MARGAEQGGAARTEQDSRARTQAGYAGFAGAAPLATREPRESRSSAGLGSGILRWARTAALTLGAMYLLSWTALTLGVVIANRSRWSPQQLPTPMIEEMRSAPMRAYALPYDPSITQEEAERAYRTLGPRPIRGPVLTPKPNTVYSVGLAWGNMRLERDVFPDARSGSRYGPSPAVLDAVRRPLNAAERELLRRIGMERIWLDFDIVARASRLDRIGAHYAMPVAEGVRYSDLLERRLTLTRQLAHAGVTRAAWHLSEGRKAEAERVLRSIVSYGFLLHDNANSLNEQTAANDVIGIARDGLIRFYNGENDPRGAAIEAAVAAAEREPSPPAIAALSLTLDFSEYRDGLHRVATSTELPRGVRYNALRGSVMNSCGSVRDVVFGQRTANRDAFDQARRDLARYPSERVLLDRMQGWLDQPVTVTYGPGDQEFLNTVDIIGRIFFNPRLAACSLRALDGGAYYER